MIRLLTILQDSFGISSDIVTELQSHFELRLVPKGKYFLSHGNIPSDYAYVSTGAFLYLQPTEDEDKVIDYAFEGAWITDLAAMIGHQPASLDIMAIEDATIATISRQSLIELADKYPILYKIITHYLEDTFVRLSVHERRLVSMDATDRYLDLMVHQAEMFDRLPVKHLASYLGIKPQSLSRIRRNIAGQG